MDIVKEDDINRLAEEFRQLFDKASKVLDAEIKLLDKREKLSPLFVSYSSSIGDKVKKRIYGEGFSLEDLAKNAIYNALAETALPSDIIEEMGGHVNVLSLQIQHAKKFLEITKVPEEYQSVFERDFNITEEESLVILKMGVLDNCLSMGRAFKPNLS